MSGPRLPARVSVALLAVSFIIAGFAETRLCRGGSPMAKKKPFCYEYPRPAVTVDVVIVTRVGRLHFQLQT